MLTSLDAVDDVVYQREDVFELAGRELADLQYSLLRDAVLHHWDACDAYRRYAAVDGWSPAMLDGPDAVISIPLLPATVFKRRDVLSCDRSDVVKICTSSGTQGSRSRIFRDDTSLERFLGSIDQGADLSLPNRAAPRRLLVLGPDTDEASDLWFSYGVRFRRGIQMRTAWGASPTRSARLACDHAEPSLYARGRLPAPEHGMAQHVLATGPGVVPPGTDGRTQATDRRPRHR
ncbi:hypothetical protein [Frankia sp. Cppng1_Ct_nod]|uniref:LuxE/PaaK family acyltransferase n=1 Tax=Frankia sp. Cppng1_Ct_nod TaxID=2897162 RepID=UPI0013EFA811|nr:hypothetical protein [Frankia sp. Cppng1_Ct_nod]